MSKQITYLNLPQRKTSPAVNEKTALLLGRRYQWQNPCPSEQAHGLCSGFTPSLQEGRPLAIEQGQAGDYCYLWDCEADQNFIQSHSAAVAANSLILTNTTLDKPELQSREDSQHLSICAHFDLRYAANAMPAHLGVIHLLESSCFYLLANGEKVVFLNTGDGHKALYLNQAHRNEPVQPILEVAQSHEPITTSFSETIHHPLAENIAGVPVESMTVLEQYQTFFMQREQPFSEENIWIPALPPISWGWSMRVARRYDGVWGIARQKLLLPNSDHNGMEMPLWQGNHLDLLATGY